MRDIHYKNRVIRMDDKTWEVLKQKRKDSGLSWNMFFVKMMKIKHGNK